MSLPTSLRVNKSIISLAQQVTAALQIVADIEPVKTSSRSLVSENHFALPIITSIKPTSVTIGDLKSNPNQNFDVDCDGFSDGKFTLIFADDATVQYTAKITSANLTKNYERIVGFTTAVNLGNSNTGWYHVLLEDNHGRQYFEPNVFEVKADTFVRSGAATKAAL